MYRTGGMRKPQTNYKTSEYCVAYLDILGAKSHICEDIDEKFLNYLNMFYEDAHIEASVFSEDVFVKIFSDNILLAIKIEKDDANKENKITTILSLVGNIQNEVLRYGYLTRGAIVEGEFFHNDIIVYGKALVQAVHNEGNLAIYPRVIAEESIYESLPKYFFKDSDGLNVLNNFLFSNDFEHISFKINLLEMLKNCKQKKVLQKIMWTIDSFNNWYASPTSRSIEKPKITKEEIQEAINNSSNISS